MSAVATGTLQGRFPYVRMGTGARSLVLLQGMSVHSAPPGRLLARGYARAFRQLAEEHTVYLLQRPHELPAGATTRDIAAAYGDLLADQIGPVDLVGMSTGGMIAQYVAVDRPALVHSLTLVVAGSRLAAAGQAICRRWQALAAAGRWRALQGDLAAIAVDGGAAQRVARTVVAATASAPSARDAADFATILDAVLGHDSTADLRSLAMPALVVGGAADPFFPAAALQATAAAIGAATLTIHPDSGHGLPKQHAGRLLQEIVAFLRR